MLKDPAAGAAAPQSVGALAQDLAGRHNARVERVWQHALRGFSADMTAERAQDMAREPSVAYVEQDGEMHAIGTQTGATWGLDRSDQRDLPLDGSYTYNVNGSNVNAYIIDTGIRRTHAEGTDPHSVADQAATALRGVRV